MRADDLKLAQTVTRIWRGEAAVPSGCCVRLAHRDQCLAYLDAAGLRPGDAISQCPGCGKDHRWALLRSLLVQALALRPAHRTRLMSEVEALLTPERERFGGEEGLKRYRAAAQAFFAKVNAKDIYRL
jgi:hypothetical protein